MFDACPNDVRVNCFQGLFSEMLDWTGLCLFKARGQLVPLCLPDNTIRIQHELLPLRIQL